MAQLMSEFLYTLSRDGDCCAALRSSLATIGSSYKHLIDEKDTRIKQLGEQASCFKGGCLMICFESSYFLRMLWVVCAVSFGQCK